MHSRNINDSSSQLNMLLKSITPPKQKNATGKQDHSDYYGSDSHKCFGKILDILNSKIVKSINFALTIIALYLNDIKIIFTKDDSDWVFVMIISIINGLFTIEFVLLFLCDDNYGCSLYFWSDLLGTLSLLLDYDVITTKFNNKFNQKNQVTFNKSTFGIMGFTKGLRSIRIVRIIQSSKIFSKSNNNKLSAKFEQSALKRIICLVLFLLVGITVFDSEIYANSYTRHSVNIKVFNKIYPEDVPFFKWTFNEFINVFHNDSDSPLIYANIFGYEYLDNYFDGHIRSFERTIVYDTCNQTEEKVEDVLPKGYEVNKGKLNALIGKKVIPSKEDINSFCVAIFNNRKYCRELSICNIIKSTVVLFTITIGFYFIENNMKNLVVAPIEKMTKKIKNMSKNPVASIQDDNTTFTTVPSDSILLYKTSREILSLEKHKLAHSCNLKKIIRCCFKEKDSLSSTIETKSLEKKISKICALLVLGFGEAGAEIISSVLQEGINVDMNPLIPGKKVMGIYGFCDIRNFTDITDVLQEKVMIFVNQVAEIVHENVSDCCGTANKNIGDAFLLVWKFDENYYGSDFKLKKCKEVSHLCDMALISFIKIIIAIKRSANLNEYRMHKGLNERMKNYEVKLGFGIHLGYSIEGAIGSMFKIDASYLSPDVDMANKLEEKTKDFEKELIFSKQFAEYLSEDSMKYVRLLDEVKNSLGEENAYYTVDLALDRILPEFKKLSTEKVEHVEEKNKMDLTLIKRKRSKLLYRKIMENKYNPWRHYERDKDFLLCRKDYKDTFMTLYNEGIESFRKGKWREAKTFFVEAQSLLKKKDVAIQKKLDFMKEWNFTPYVGWDGIRYEN